jgi:hypothetical protein
MAARQNYGFERRRKDQLRRAKQEEKRARKNEREESGVTGPEMGEAQVVAAPTGLWEWFSPSRTRTITTAVGTRPEGSEPDDWVLLTETSTESEPAS